MLIYIIPIKNSAVIPIDSLVTEALREDIYKKVLNLTIG
jgi:hypothetical protein